MLLTYVENEVFAMTDDKKATCNHEEYILNPMAGLLLVLFSDYLCENMLILCRILMEFIIEDYSTTTAEEINLLCSVLESILKVCHHLSEFYI